MVLFCLASLLPLREKVAAEGRSDEGFCSANRALDEAPISDF